ncbi:MAG: PIN domain-containing protein [Candidatus Magasanikbacteria bacterium]|nr:PIN domain-containing protein [Candidatus Magasanikbacteria bacterium]
MKIKVYADTNVYLRPFDDWRNQHIAREGLASLEFWRMAKENLQIYIMSSDLVKLELCKLDHQQTEQARLYLQFVKCNLQNEKHIEIYAVHLMEEFNLSAHDALHLSFAKNYGCNYFLTCDKELYAKKYLGDVKIINPIEFIKVFK